MSNALQDITTEQLSPDYVNKRIDDWIARVDALYRMIEHWLPEGWTARRIETVFMDEELMRKAGVGPRKLPVLSLSSPKEAVARIEPQGLWIIGANGRVDLRGRKGTFIILDSADTFAKPEWRIAPISNRTRIKALDEESFRKAL